MEKGLIWAGTNDGKIWYTRDGGGKWNDVTKNITGCRRMGDDREDRAVDFRRRHRVRRRRRAPHGQPRAVHLQDDRLRRRRGEGQSAICRASIRSTTCWRWPRTRTSRGCCSPAPATRFYYSLDDGANWTQVKEGLPAAPVTWVVVQKRAITTSWSRRTGAGCSSSRHHAAGAATMGRPTAAQRVYAPRAACATRAADAPSSSMR